MWTIVLIVGENEIEYLVPNHYWLTDRCVLAIYFYFAGTIFKTALANILSGK